MTCPRLRRSSKSSRNCSARNPCWSANSADAHPSVRPFGTARLSRAFFSHWNRGEACMRLSALAIAIGFGVAPLAGAAHAADAISIPLSTDASITVHEQEGRDWSGFYAGLYGVVQNSPAGGDQIGAG